MTERSHPLDIPSTASADLALAHRMMRWATYASVAVATALIAAKAVAWIWTGSVAMLSSLVDSGLDVLASMLNMLAVRHALTPADREHRFGHGKAEALAGLGQSAFILASAGFVLYEAVRRFRDPRPVEQGAFGIGVMLLSIALTLALLFYQRRVVRRTGSLAIGADSLHYQTDLMTNGAVLVGLVLATQFGLRLADPAIAACIAVYIGFSAWIILRGSFDQLMDRELPDEDRARIRAVALGHPEIHNVHEIRTRSSGLQRFIQLHLEMDPALSLVRAHEIADEVEEELKQAFPNAEIFIHQDPAEEIRPANAL